MSTVYVKKLSGEVIPLELSPDDLLFPAVRSLGVDPGYTFRLFSQEGVELSRETAAKEVDHVSVVYLSIPTYGGIMCLHYARIRSAESDAYEFYVKFTMEIKGIDVDEKIEFVHAMDFYTQSYIDIETASDRVFIPADSCEYRGDDERCEQTGKAFGGIEELVEHFVPQIYSEEIRGRMRKKLMGIWNGSTRFY
jgi:hypothetical protein